MYYNLSTYEPRQKFSHRHLGKQSAGKEKIIHQYENENIEDLDKSKDNLEEDDLDEFVDAVNKKIGQKTANSSKIKITDYFRGRQDNGGLSKNVPLFEFSGHHQNTIRQGISPYPQKKHSGGPIGTGGSSQAFRTTGNFKRTGTLFGWSRPHKNLSTVEDEYIFNLQDMLHPLERSFMRQQNKIRTLFNDINKSL